LLEKVLSCNENFDDYLLDQALPDKGHVRGRLSGRRGIGEQGKPEMILLSIVSV